MSELRQREEPIRSRHYLDGAKGECCKLRFEGCPDDGTMAMSCHLTGVTRGMQRKEHDILVVDGCLYCHTLLDTRRTGLSEGEIAIVVLRALSETLVARHAAERLTVKLDKPKRVHDRKAKPRRPKNDRAKVQHNPDRGIPQRADPWPKGRKIPARVKL